MADITEMPGPDAEPSQLRKWAEAQQAENKALRSQLIGAQLREIGLDPDTGLGKAIAKEYAGSIDPDAVATFAAEEYGYTPAPPAQETDTPPAPPVEAPPTRAQELAAVSNPLDVTMANSAPVEPVSVDDMLARFDQAAGRGEATRADAVTSIAHKVAIFERDRE